MPFDPVTGAWLNPVQQPFQTPNTTAGDVIGGFQSYSAYANEQERRRLERMMTQLNLEEGQYDFERKQYEDSTFDEFSTQLPMMNADQAEQAIIGLPNAGRAQTALISSNSQRDRQRTSQATQMMRNWQKAVMSGSMDANAAADEAMAAFPDMPHLSNSLRVMRRDPLSKGRQDLVGAQTGYVQQKTKALEEMRPLSVKGKQLQNELLQLKKVTEKARATKLQSVGKSSGLTASQKLAALRLLLSAQDKVAGDFKENMLMDDDPEFEQLKVVGKEVIYEVKQILSEEDVPVDNAPAAAPGAKPSAAAPSGEVKPPPGAEIIKLY